ncbi:MAG: hypothetical protein RLZZ546_2567, partial [Bacteroidota bacterium]
MRKQKGYWNIKENCFNEALKYSTRTEFHKNNRIAFKYASKNNWLDEICSH